ncbi:hypothetical protein WALSEDRAFT_67285 [Wallemia mellicola CBS 633.66]|uniref:Uncharacterized protein n=1 Tax=Wallemia mellicola (strain ATCC MYA-4683 / CBS 633.66) TaxID=671144 RepID=I4YI62_WALMC|nr:hypothetical protein WALSEDRAFT_67285 [Wallemia mellicola CBS 633.66]EIM23654.1 hypothetical protein WALSEDRAFT_67285 [Wallemia mellicola CBS 633.66]|eukprot:XP_006956322.1 hypothetical protein WALSEDRAFT_67285 [Wallemia mellicola CBS 633.66]
MSIYSLLRDGEQFTETTSSSDYNSRIDTYSKATLVEIHSIVRSLENDLSLCLRDDYKQQSILNVKHYSDIVYTLAADFHNNINTIALENNKNNKEILNEITRFNARQMQFNMSLMSWLQTSQRVKELNNADLVNLVKSSRQFYALAIEQLYNTIDLSIYEDSRLVHAIINLIYSLNQSSNNSRHIRKLKLNYSSLNYQIIRKNLLQNLLELIPATTYTSDGRKRRFVLKIINTEPEDILHTDRIANLLTQIPQLETLVMVMKSSSKTLTVKRDQSSQIEEFYEFVRRSDEST